jgi:hypothetical protein
MYHAPGSIVLGTDTGAALPQMPLDAPKQLFRYGEQSIWSSQFHAGASAIVNGTFRLFTTPQGQQGQGYNGGLSIAETNLKEGGRIPNGVAYDVFGIALQPAHFTQAADGQTAGAPVDNDVAIGDLTNILANGVATWDFTQTTVDVCPLTLIGAGGGVFGALAAATTNPATTIQIGNMNNGAGSVWLYRKYPIALPGNTTFAMLLRYGSRAPNIGVNAIELRFVLLGYYKNIIEIA